VHKCMHVRAFVYVRFVHVHKKKIVYVRFVHVCVCVCRVCARVRAFVRVRKGRKGFRV